MPRSGRGAALQLVLLAGQRQGDDPLDHEGELLAVMGMRMSAASVPGLERDEEGLRA
jgi:hypothetical protein